MKSKIIGYIISTPCGVWATTHHGSTEEQKALWFGGTASLFPTRAVAKRYIRRTQEYATKYDRPWTWAWQATIYPVRGI